MKKKTYLTLLDRALAFAVRHTDPSGRMVVDGEIDCKDSGWLVLGAAIRGRDAGWTEALRRAVRSWTLASVRNDDRRSVWTTFALLYSQFLAPESRTLFSASEAAEIAAFFDRLDLRYLLEASRNYRVAAALIEVLRVRCGYASTMQSDPDSHIQAMLDSYLGDGFFNDDDCRGSRADRRIDAYSGEIIGLLLHYDELFAFRSPFHDRIRTILDEFLDAAEYLTDADGELAKWGRSLRGEAEVKKIFLWECAGRRSGVPARMLKFFERVGMSAEGQVFKDKGGNRGIWDEYTTHVQAQGYGIYGLAAALHYSRDEADDDSALPADRGGLVRLFAGPGLAVAVSETKTHCVVPLRNRMTKNMYFWHNRITGENDVEVDVSAKFLPIPYFGRRMPAPYSGGVIGWIPQLELANGTLLVPRNLDPECVMSESGGAVRAGQHFQFCRVAQYEAASELEFRSSLELRPGKLAYRFTFSGEAPSEAKLVVRFFGSSPRVMTASGSLSECCEGPSIYGGKCIGKKLVVAARGTSVLEYELEF